jgi:hypothetical protein
MSEPSRVEYAVQDAGVVMLFALAPPLLVVDPLRMMTKSFSSTPAG